jgi:hypothetical protein
VRDLLLFAKHLFVAAELVGYGLHSSRGARDQPEPRRVRRGIEIDERFLRRFEKRLARLNAIAAACASAYSLSRALTFAMAASNSPVHLA